MSKAARLAFVLLLAGAVAIAFAPIFVRLSELGPTATAFYRTALAVPMLGLWLAFAGRGAASAPIRPKMREMARLWLAGFFFAGDLAVWHISIHYTSVANATLLANMAPIFVTLGGFWLFRERFSPRFVLGMALALGGAVVLMGDSATLSRRSLEGDVLGVLTAMFYASYILAIGRLRARHTTVVIMFWSTLATTVFLLPVALLSGEPMIAETGRGWLVLLGLALVSQSLGQGLIAYALAHLQAAFSSVSLLVQPVVAAFLAWMLFAEALGPLQAFGGAIVLAGVLVARQGSRARGANQQPDKR